MEAEAQGDTLVVTHAKLEGKTLEANSMVDMLAYRLSHVQAKTICDSLADEKTEALVDTLANTLAVVTPVTLGDTVGNVEAVTLVDTLVVTLAEVEAKLPTVGDKEAEVLVDTMADTLAKRQAETVRDILAYVKPKPYSTRCLICQQKWRKLATHWDS